ncbi:MAG: ATP-binding protein, partial [Cyanobacteria bacterium]|nr:ATP-binding protein [Cyanobacteriota bacterium]MDW8200844.1 ATP-binding protein [Cyanobacteriota bacterium SKYGB_h_bin112]
TRQAQHKPLSELPVSLIAAAKHDLQVLQSLYRREGRQIGDWIQQITDLPTAPVWYEPELGRVDAAWLHNSKDWTIDLPTLAAHYRQHGIGLLGEYRTLRWQQGQLVGVLHPDVIYPTDLVGYEWQRSQLLKNTEFLLAGYPAQNVLLYGSRGSGKSSLVKSLVSAFGDRGLRLIEVAKPDLKDLPTIIELLRDAPQKIILFVDDLSFEEDGDDYRALKAVLEGSVVAKAPNVVVYATSNRRHLVREFLSDRPSPSQSDEVHAWDTVQEKLSFSDRFGLTLTFEPADQTTYLAIVHALADQAHITLDSQTLDHYALQWATRYNGRSGRTARQFIDFLRADLAINGAQSDVQNVANHTKLG